MSDLDKILSSIDVKVIMLCRFGSHLYGTDTPESDTDYKGIFMPTKEMVLLGKIPKSINNNKKKAEGQKMETEPQEKLLIWNILPNLIQMQRLLRLLI